MKFPAVEGDEFTVVVMITGGESGSGVMVVGLGDNGTWDGTQVVYPSIGGAFRISQTPVPTNLNFSASQATNNNLWGYPDGSDFSRITASDSGSAINVGYGNFKQTPIPNSLFKSPTETWNLQSGDEFRFEDREDRTYMVKSFITPDIHPSGTLEVQLDAPIPNVSVNLDHFLIRRYVPDGSSIIIGGTKPSGSTGTALVSPQYVTDPLDKGSGETILDLTERGLI